MKEGQPRPCAGYNPMAAGFSHALRRKGSLETAGMRDQPAAGLILLPDGNQAQADVSPLPVALGNVTVGVVDLDLEGLP